MNIRKSISLFGYFFSYGFLLLTIFTFYHAYINPNKMILITINSFNEQYIEIICFIFIFIIATYGLYFTIKEYKEVI